MTVFSHLILAVIVTCDCVYAADTSCSSDDIEIVGDEVICPAKEFGPFLCTARGRNMQVDNLLFLGSDQEGTIRMNNHTRAELIRVTHENGEGSALGTRVAKIHITLGPDSESLVITCGADDVGMCNYTISVVESFEPPTVSTTWNQDSITFTFKEDILDHYKIIVLVSSSDMESFNVTSTTTIPRSPHLSYIGTVVAVDICGRESESAPFEVPRSGCKAIGASGVLIVLLLLTQLYMCKYYYVNQKDDRNSKGLSLWKKKQCMASY